MSLLDLTWDEIEAYTRIGLKAVAGFIISTLILLPYDVLVGVVFDRAVSTLSGSARFGAMFLVFLVSFIVYLAVYGAVFDWLFTEIDRKDYMPEGGG